MNRSDLASKTSKNSPSPIGWERAGVRVRGEGAVRLAWEFRLSLRRLLRPFVHALRSVLLLCFLTRSALPASTTEPPLVLTQLPLPTTAPPHSARTILDARYPTGSRVVIARPPYEPGRIVPLSGSLAAAGSPFVTWDGKRVLFVGKSKAEAAWQIYEANLNGGPPKALTDMPGGAMDPAFISTGDLVFLSPVPSLDLSHSQTPRASVFAQPPHGPARRLTSGTADATDLTVLADGRILFVTALPEATSAASQALFSVNNDGTEFALYAGQHERSLRVQRPREVGNRIVYLATDPKTGPDLAWPEAVRTARPFSHQERLFPFATAPCRSIEDGTGGTYLASFEKPRAAGDSPRASSAIYCLGTNATTLGQPFFDDPAWDNLEAAFLVERAKPMGHISVMSADKKSGSFLCLDANYTSYRPANGDAPKAESVRISVLAENGSTNWLGSVPVSADGSFMAEVPADLPVGFEALDIQGRVLRSVPPIVWVRAGENRSCIGCHEPHGRSPRNHRPLAVRSPTPNLAEPPGRVGHKPALP